MAEACASQVEITATLTAQGRKHSLTCGECPDHHPQPHLWGMSRPPSTASPVGNVQTTIHSLTCGECPDHHPQPHLWGMSRPPSTASPVGNVQTTIHSLTCGECPDHHPQLLSWHRRCEHRWWCGRGRHPGSNGKLQAVHPHPPHSTPHRQPPPGLCRWSPGQTSSAAVHVTGRAGSR